MKSDCDRQVVRNLGTPPRLGSGGGFSATAAATARWDRNPSRGRLRERLLPEAQALRAASGPRFRSISHMPAAR